MLSSPSRLSLFKIFSNLSSDPLIQQPLVENNFIHFVVPLIGKNNNNPKELNYLLLALNYTCGYDQARYVAVIKAGALPSLIHHASASAPYRELAITIFLRLCSQPENISALLSCGSVDFLVDIAKSSQFTTIALERLALLCSDTKATALLLADQAKIITIGSLIINSEPSTLGSIASSLHTLCSKCPGLAAKIATQKNVLAFVVDKITRKALSVEFRIRTVEVLFDMIFELLTQMQDTTKNARAVFEFTYHLIAPLHAARDATQFSLLLNTKINLCIELLEDDSKTKKQLQEEKKKRTKEEKRKKEKEDKKKEREEKKREKKKEEKEKEKKKEKEKEEKKAKH
jgi:hypothetical protein